MIIDAQNQFSAAQAITASAVSTNVIDLALLGRNLGVGEPMFVVIQCSVAMTDGSSDSTVTCTLVTDDNSSISSGTSIQTIGSFAALSAAGTTIYSRLPVSASYERYLAIQYTVANGNLTTGSFNAFLTHDIQHFTAYADNITIS